MQTSPADLVNRQMARDARRTWQRPWLLERKNQRMAESPFAFLRGTAALFYELLKECPALARGHTGEGWLSGDLHLENFGAFRINAVPPEEGGPLEPAGHEVVFDINDFDEAIVGPLQLDLLRLTTSVLLGARQEGCAWGADVTLAARLIESYAEVLEKGTPASPTTPLPPPVAAVLASAGANSTTKLMARYTEGTGAARRFRLKDNLHTVSDAERKAVIEAFTPYADELAAGNKVYRDRMEPLDVAFRVAGTGSLGAERFAILTEGKVNKEGGWLFDMKQQFEPAAAVLLPAPALAPAQRVVDAMRACLASPTRMLGVTTLNGNSMVVRRLSAQEDKLKLAELPIGSLGPTLDHLGACVALAHRRGSAAVVPWTRQDREGLLERALVVAGIHEACWLAFKRRLAG